MQNHCLTDDRHLEEGLKVIIYHGRGREVDPMALADSDIVLSTYHTVAAEATDSKRALFRINWFRFILDEGINPQRNGSICNSNDDY